MASLEDLQAKLSRLPAAYRDAVDRVLHEQADFLVERAQANAPVLSGTLRDSIHVENQSTAARPAYVVIADAPYAYAVHERPPNEDKAHVDETTPEGYPGAGYLRRPLYAAQPRLRENLAAALQQVTEQA